MNYSLDVSDLLSGPDERPVELMNPCDMYNVNFNCSLDDYLYYVLGPRRLPLAYAIPITVVYTVIFFTGVLGNAAVCVVIVKHPSMHTATNYYLFSLAVSDLMLLLLGLPNDLSVYWHQYPYSLGVGFCKFRALFSETSSYVSVLTIVAFSMERYLAICHPLHSYTMAGLKRAVRIIAVLWIVALISASPFAMFTTINYLNYPPNSSDIATESAFCALLYLPQGWHLYEASSLLFFLAPMLVIMALYARMGLRIRHTKRHSLGKGVRGSVHGITRQAQRRKPIIRMLAAVVIAFFLCWMPFHAQRVFFVHGKQWEYFEEVNEWLFSVAGWLYYISSTVNPILYNIMSNRYRVAFKETLCGAGRKNNRRQTGTITTAMSCREHSTASVLYGGGGGSGDSAHLMRGRSSSRRYRPNIWRRSKDAEDSIGAGTGPDAKGVLLELTSGVVAQNGRANCCLQATIKSKNCCTDSPDIASRRRETFI